MRQTANVTNLPIRRALGVRISEAQPLSPAAAAFWPQFYAQHPPYVAGARGDPNLIGGPGWWDGANGSAINAGYFENLRELAVGQSLPGFLRHYYQGARR
jgi:hypothetical protein